MKGPSILINPKKLLCSLDVQLMNTKEFGAFMVDIVKKLERKDFEPLKNIKGIERVFSGTAKRESIPPSIRKLVLSTGYCLYCYSTENLTIDHIIPYSKGGSNDLGNLQCLCFTCNRKKSDKI